MQNNIANYEETKLSKMVKVNFVLATLFLAGCSSFPEKASIVAFGQAADRVSQIGNVVYESNKTLGLARNVKESQLEYLQNGKVTFGERDIITVDQGQWKVRLVMLSAIGRYASELSKLNDPAAAERAAAAAKSLVASVSSVVAPNAERNLAPALSSVIAKLATSNFISTNLKRVIVETDPTIQIAVRLLASDFDLLSGVPIRNAKGISRANISLLNIVRTDHKISKIELKKFYNEIVKEELTTASRLLVMKAMSGALKKLAAAHRALAKSKDQDRSIAVFISAANEIGTIFSIPEITFGATK